MTKQQTATVLSALNRPEFLNALRQAPVESIVIQRGVKGESGAYDESDRSIEINAIRKRGQQLREPALRPGQSYSVSSATQDKLESMRRSLLQELAHHLEHTHPEVRHIVETALADPRRKPITIYAREVQKEYFPESLAAYFADPEALSRYDPVGFTMVKKVLDLLHP